MKTLISRWFAAAKCVWCEREKECVTAEFGDGFLAKSQICWRCLQKAIKVRSQQDKADSEGKSNNAKPDQSRQTKTAPEQQSAGSET